MNRQNKFIFINTTKELNENERDLTVSAYRKDLDRTKTELEKFKISLMLNIESDIEKQIKRAIEEVFKV